MTICNRLKISVDRDGTFPDCIASRADGDDIFVKILSLDPQNYADAPSEAIRRVLLEIHRGEKVPRGIKLDLQDVESARMGTTVATNALLERTGERCALFVTNGFKDLFHIGNQSRPDMFDAAINKPEVLYSEVYVVEERVTLEGWSESKLPSKTKADGRELVKGVSGVIVKVLEPLDVKDVCDKLNHAYKAGITARGLSATADAYITPVIKGYITIFKKGFVEEGFASTSCQFMQSDGGLIEFSNLSGLRAILSGPAGGVVGYSITEYDENSCMPIIGFDMGGTSTDVSGFGETYEHIFETTTAGVSIQSPQLDINTVAAGGGSLLHWKNGLFTVGPDSAGAHPCPACYQNGGPLTIIDANLVLGRLIIEKFPAIFGPNEDQPLDVETSLKKFAQVTAQINLDTGKSMALYYVAEGFLKVANEAM